jgi:16S rRNA C967 or C1407 C5-methylase (RsmB/RsmF family)
MTTFPSEFEQRMRAVLGDEWEAFRRAHSEPSPVSIRVNPAKLATWEGVAIPWTQYGKYLKTRPSFTLDPLFHAGAYYVQEASSMFLEQVFVQHAPDTSGLKVLDLCAAPGGKSTHIISLLKGDSLLVSNEVIRSRVSVLTENLQKWGYHNSVVTNNDPSDFSQLNGFFDVIVIDAPCSGEGLFRKDPSAIEEWSPENVLLCSNRQQRILEDVWPALRENGILIYSTCTYSPAEDENILQWIDGTYDVEFLSLNTKDWNIETVTTGNGIGYRFYPHRVNGEGFFLAALRKKNSEREVTIRTGKGGFASPEKKTSEELKEWVNLDEMKLIQRNDLVQGIPSNYADAIYVLTQRLRVNYSGVFLATVKHNKLVPEHTLAVSTLINKEHFHKEELSEHDALLYLKKEPFNTTSDHRGFALATYKGMPLGWMNMLQGRINNLYPAEWRIRMQLK